MCGGRGEGLHCTGNIAYPECVYHFPAFPIFMVLLAAQWREVVGKYMNHCSPRIGVSAGEDIDGYTPTCLLTFGCLIHFWLVL